MTVSIPVAIAIAGFLWCWAGLTYILLRAGSMLDMEDKLVSAILIALVLALLVIFWPIPMAARLVRAARHARALKVAAVARKLRA